jgi:hypothetical protein
MQKWNNFVNDTKPGDVKIDDLKDISLPPLVKTAAIQKDISLV